MVRQYILDENKNPVPCPNADKWAQWCSDRANGRVALTTIGKYTISTVFLALDHNFSIGGLPILFETMVSTKKDGFLDYQERYSTWKEAEAGHTLACYAAETNPKYLETGETE